MRARAAPCNPLPPSRLLPLPRRTEHGVKFLCDRCKTQYSIGDDRVRGKILKIRCKNCGNVITVREGMSSEPEHDPSRHKKTTGAPDALDERQSATGDRSAPAHGERASLPNVGRARARGRQKRSPGPPAALDGRKSARGDRGARAQGGRASLPNVRGAGAAAP